MRLGELVGPQWEAELQTVVNGLTETIQALADHLWNPLGGITTAAPTRMLRTLDWHVLVSAWGPTDEIGKLELQLSKVDSDGRGPWLANRKEIAAVLCLWMTGFRDKPPSHRAEDYAWLVGCNDDNTDIGRGLSDWWISRQSSRVEVQPDGTPLETDDLLSHIKGKNILDCAVPMDDPAADAAGILAKFPDSGLQTRPAFQTSTMPVVMATQYLLSAFVSFAVRWVEPIDSPVEIVIVDDQRVLAITNDAVSGLADVVQRLGQVTREDAHRIVVPALARAQKLPRIAIQLLKLAETGGRDWPFHGRAKDAVYKQRAMEFYRLLEAACIGEINTLIGQKRWNAAGEILARLEATFTRILGSTDVRTVSVAETKDDLCNKIIALDDIERSTTVSLPTAPPPLCKFPLHAAVRSGSSAVVYEALRLHQTDINLIDDNGMSPLHLAALQCTPPIMQLLLLHGARPDSRADTSTATALHLAIGGDADTWTTTGAQTIDLLLHNGAAVNAGDGNGDTPLTLAATKGFTECAERLVAHGADVNVQNNKGDTAVLLATHGGHAAFVRCLVANQADLNIPNTAGDTPLIIAAQFADGDIAKRLIDGGASIDLVVAAGRGLDVVLKLLTSSGDVPQADLNSSLLTAASTGHARAVRVLVDNKADVNARDGDGNTPLILTSAGGHTDVAQLLLDHGADVSAVGQRDVTALLAVSPENTAILELLLRAGSDANVRDKFRSSALHLAALGGHEPAVQLLVGYGADVAATMDDGSTPLHSAASSGSAGVTRVLLGMQPDLDAVDENGDTPLLVAVQGGHLEVVELLVDGGADVGVMNGEGVTAMKWAEINGDEAVRVVLLRGRAGSGGVGGGGDGDVETALV